MVLPLANILNSGTQFASNNGERRNIKLTNFISLIISSALIFILAFRYFTSQLPLWFALPLAWDIGFFILLIYLNSIKLNTLSRILLSWSVVLIVFWNLRVIVINAPGAETSHYVGFRIFQIVFSSFPFLIFNFYDWRRMLVAVSLPLFCMIFYDQILDLLGIGYFDVGLKDTSYTYNTLRALVGFFILSSSFLFLKRIIEKQENLNAKLIDEIEEKNRLIQKQADDELNQLNMQLLANLDALSKSEIVLKNAQSIAKVGSYEYNHTDSSVYWSEQMYEIFEINPLTDPSSLQFKKLLTPGSVELAISSFNRILNDKAEIDITVQTQTTKGHIKWLRIIGHPTIKNNAVERISGIVHDITYFKESEQRLVISEKNYRALFEQASDAIMITDLKGQFIDVNTRMCTLLGYEKDELLQLSVKDILDLEQSPHIDLKALASSGQIINERLFIHRSGMLIPVESNVTRFNENNLIEIARDLSERKDTAKKLRKYIRELALLNTITAASSKATDVTTLLTTLGDVLVAEGGYKLVWIGKEYVSEDNHAILPILQFGPATKYVEKLIIDLHDETHRNGPSAQALLTGNPIAINQTLNDLRFEHWRNRAAAWDLYSSVALLINTEVDEVGKLVLNIYSGEADSFQREEINILTRIVASITSSIRAIHAAKERDHTKRELQRTYERLSYHINNTPLAVIERDKHHNITYWNKRAEELFGWTESEALGRKPQDLLAHPEDRENVKNLIDVIRANKVNSMFQERKILSKYGDTLFTQWYYSITRDEWGDAETVLSFVSDVTEQRTANALLGKRIKEMTALHQVSQLLGAEDKPLADVFQEIAQVLPSGWQHTEVCAAKLTVFGKTYTSDNYNESDYRQVMDIQLEDKRIGSIEVVYLEKRADQYDGPFLLEERNLLSVIAGMLQIYITRKREHEALVEAQANLAATINNTEIMIWSVDYNFNLLTFNESFRKYNKDRYGIDLTVGENYQGLLAPETVSKWEQRYVRALLGEIVIIEEKVGPFDFRFSLSPIIENTKVTGVTIFADNVTEHNEQHRQLADANKKITELKIQALRSVMNPHFIFNVLSSIQYFITRNDELNALNYLTSFSKLMRTVLTRSVADTVSLQEEMDMLTDYVKLEKLRFEEKFNFNIEYVDDFELDSVRIPSLLIQPYVENAILHGLYNKIGQGNLTIRVKGDEEYLLFEIEDDGIGREAAFKIKAATEHTRKSLGTKLTEERLKLLNSDSELAVNYIDLFKNESPAGTIVQIKIKLHSN